MYNLRRIDVKIKDIYEYWWEVDPARDSSPIVKLGGQIESLEAFLRVLVHEVEQVEEALAVIANTAELGLSEAKTWSDPWGQVWQLEDALKGVCKKVQEVQNL